MGMKYEIVITEIFDQWLSKLKDKQASIAVNMRIARVREGNFGDVKSVGGHVSELRIFVGKGYRVYFTIQGSRIVLLLNGGHKGTQASDIEKAKQIFNELE